MTRREKVLAERVPPLAEVRRRLEAEPLPRNLGALLDEASDAVPDRQVLHFIDSGESFTYRELRAAVNRLTNGFAVGSALVRAGQNGPDAAVELARSIVQAIGGG